MRLWNTKGRSDPVFAQSCAGARMPSKVFYFTVKLVEKETKLGRAQFMQARLKNQRELVENILASDRSYRRRLHDYRNQL